MDGEIVVIHDGDLKRVGGVPMVVAESTARELGWVDVGSWFDLAYSDERVPSLREVLDLCAAEDPVAVQVGGPSGQMVGEADFDRQICFDDTKHANALDFLGSYGEELPRLHQRLASLEVLRGTRIEGRQVMSDGEPSLLAMPVALWVQSAAPATSRSAGSPRSLPGAGSRDGRRTSPQPARRARPSASETQVPAATRSARTGP